MADPGRIGAGQHVSAKITSALSEVLQTRPCSERHGTTIRRHGGVVPSPGVGVALAAQRDRRRDAGGRWGGRRIGAHERGPGAGARLRDYSRTTITGGANAARPLSDGSPTTIARLPAVGCRRPAMEPSALVGGGQTAQRQTTARSRRALRPSPGTGCQLDRRGPPLDAIRREGRARKAPVYLAST